MRVDLDTVVGVRAPGRLHLGFLDPAGTLGRRFGSLGLTIDGFETAIELHAADADADADEVVAAGPAEQTDIERADIERAAACLRRLRQHTGRHQPLHLRLLRALPAHAGFGSGTQLAMAIGHAFVRWHGLAATGPTLARWLGRGARSGIGIAGFDHGGLLLDGGPGADGAPAPLLARLPFPEAWRVVVVGDASHRGLSGSDEDNAIAGLPPLPQAAAADICHQLLMRILPGVASADFMPFADGLNQMQSVLGAHFAPRQGGSAYTSPATGRLMHWAASAAPWHPAALGQSSWGPTGFAVVASQAAAEALVEAARRAGAVDRCLTLDIVAGRNSGAATLERRRRC